MRAREAVGEARDDGIAAEGVYNRDRQIELIHQEIGRALRDDQIDRYPHKFPGQFRHPLKMVVAVAQHEDEVAPLDIAEILETVAECLDVGLQARRLLRGNPANARNPLRALCDSEPGQRGDGKG